MVSPAAGRSEVWPGRSFGSAGPHPSRYIPWKILLQNVRGGDDELYNRCSANSSGWRSSSGRPVDARLRADLDLPLSSFEPMQVIAQTRCLPGPGHRRRHGDHRRGHQQARRPAWNQPGTAGADPTRTIVGPRWSNSPRRARNCSAEASEVVDDELEMRIGAVLSARSRQQFVVALTSTQIRRSPAGRASSETEG